MLFYIISEENTLASDSLEDNKNLGSIIELKIKKKFPLFIFLTHSDTYCKKVMGHINENENWEQICKNNINKNKINFLSYIKKLIENKNLDYQIDYQEIENNIIHVVLVEHKKITDDEAIKKMPKRTRDKYEKESDKEKQKYILETFIDGLEADENEIRDFFNKEGINILNKEKLIKKIKEKLPSQYHNVFNL